MNSEEWARIESVFHDALQRRHSERAAFLDLACGDDRELRKQVESLIAGAETNDKSFQQEFLRAAAQALSEEPGNSMLGRMVGHYEILSLAGTGGMGQVYRARDTHLDRVVAIKVLPPQLVGDADRRRRFVQEAKSASALNHPNIVTVHDIACEGGLDFMVMEFVTGKPLDQVIGRKGLKLSEALKYAVQIADALAAAHAAGIVHRDLKPANVIVGNNGVVKVLDFGIAKLVEPTPGEQAPTKISITEAGSIIGTPAYMSPEQAEGKKLDTRSDIFSFGSLLYEMLSGRQAFRGESNFATLSAITSREPDPLPPEIPQELENLIVRCLRKEPERRIQHIGDVKLTLQDLKESDSGQPAVAGATGPRLRLSHLGVVAALVLIAAAGMMLWLSRPTRPALLLPPTLTRLTTDSGLTTDPALSPDGKLLAYASDRNGQGNLDVYVRQVGGGDPIRLTQDPADDHEPTFSRDGTKIVFRSERDGGGIYVVSSLGGTARLIAPQGQWPQFSPDGNWIAYSVGRLGADCLAIRKTCATYVVASAGGTPREIEPDFVGTAYPIWSPDGTRLLFLGSRDEKAESADWWTTPLSPGPAIRTGALQAISRQGLTGPLILAPGAVIASAWDSKNGVVFSAASGDSKNLWSMDISPTTWQITSIPRRMTFGPTLEVSPSVAAGPGTTRIAFAALNENLDIWSLFIDAKDGKAVGEPKRLTDDAAADFFPALSPDGNRMVFVSSRSGGQEIWIKDLRSGEESALTASVSQKWLPLFSPDGSKVSFTQRDQNLIGVGFNGYVVPSRGGALEMICEQCGEAVDWSSDGKRILGNEELGAVWLVDLAAHRRTSILALPGHSLVAGHFSPDERWIIVADYQRSMQTYIAPFRGEIPIRESQLIPTMEGARDWSPDGATVYGRSSRDGFLCFWAQRLDPTTKHPVGSPFPVFHSHSSRLTLSGAFLRRNQLVLTMAERTGNIWMAEWKER